MSDYNPNLGPNGPDRYGRYDTDPAAGSGRSGLVLLAGLAGVALVGGFLYFGNPQNGSAPQQAQAPIATERTLTETPATPNPDRSGGGDTIQPAAPTAPMSPAPATPQE